MLRMACKSPLMGSQEFSLENRVIHHTSVLFYFEMFKSECREHLDLDHAPSEDAQRCPRCSLFFENLKITVTTGKVVTSL